MVFYSLGICIQQTFYLRQNCLTLTDILFRPLQIRGEGEISNHHCTMYILKIRLELKILTLN